MDFWLGSLGGRRSGYRWRGGGWRLDYNCRWRWRDGYSRPRRNCARRSAGRRTGNNDGPRRRTGSDGRRGGWRSRDNGRSLTRLGHNLTRFRPGRNNGHRGSRDGRSGVRDGCGRRTHHDGGRSSGWRGRRALRILGGALRFLLAGQNGLHYIAGLGDVGEVNLGAIFLLGPRRRHGPRSTLQKSTDLLSLACFDGA
jgi:hypothetical protein